MKPLGRKHYNDKSGGKHSCRIEGVYCSWWENTCTPNKRLEQRNAKREIEDEILEWELSDK